MRTPITHISFRALIPLLLFFTLVINAPELSAAPAGSTYPVQVNPMLIPPYSLYLSDYFTGTTERVSLTLTNRDLQQPQVRVKLRLTIACASGLTLTTHPQAVFDPIVLDAGVPTRLTMQELAPYFLPARLLTQGYMQGGKLAEGNIEFGFEVLEYNTGKVLSQKNIAFGNIISPKPPKLNLPINNDIVTVNEPQQLTFQWSPQYFSTGNVEYEFVIKELMDKTASPQEAFLYSREVYRTTTTASAINYTMGEPTLEGNKRYAWCVRAVMHEGVETANRFENDGYSPVSVFNMRYDCRPPTDVQATTERGAITLHWLPQPHHLKYVVSYRRTDFDANTWYTKTTTGTSINLSDIAPGQNYTYRVGAYCDDNTPVYSASGTISVPAEDTEFLANCGKDPQIKITNRKPKGQLNVNDIIMAGDFPVTITSVNGSNGTFTGEGYVRIPYLFARFAVRFSGIGVNEENHLISGQIETKYDKTESGIANLDALDQGGTDGNIKSGITKANKTVEFALPEKFTVQYSEELATLTFKDETGTAIGNVDIPKNPAGKPILPLTVEDKNGNVYEVHENPEKSTTNPQPYVAVKLGKQEGEIPFGSMDLNVQDEAKATVTFANDASSLYALDSWQNYYSSVGIISGGNGDPNSNFDGCKYEKIGANYWVKWKYIPPGKTDKVTAELLISDKAKIDPAKVVFKTKAGKVFESSYNATTHNFTITLLGGEDKDGQELYAMHPATESGKYWNLGKLDMMSYAPVERKMVLVKTSANDNTDASAVQTELNRIYNPVGISWSVSSEQFTYNTDNIFEGKSGIISTYLPNMRTLNAAFMAAKADKLEPKTAYLFLVNQTAGGDRDKQGFMPRGMQFGYINTSTANVSSVIAHELGHGAFKLYHTFNSGYGSTAVGTQGKTENLMDYKGGTNLAKWQWDQMYDPAILNGVFDSDKEAAKINVSYNYLLPSHKPFRFKAGDGNLDDDCIVVNPPTNGNYPNGTLYSFVIGNTEYFYKSEDENFHSTDGKLYENAYTPSSAGNEFRLIAQDATDKCAYYLVKRILKTSNYSTPDLSITTDAKKYYLCTKGKIPLNESQSASNSVQCIDLPADQSQITCKYLIDKNFIRLNVKCLEPLNVTKRKQLIEEIAGKQLIIGDDEMLLQSLMLSTPDNQAQEIHKTIKDKNLIGSILTKTQLAAHNDILNVLITWMRKYENSKTANKTLEYSENTILPNDGVDGDLETDGVTLKTNWSNDGDWAVSESFGFYDNVFVCFTTPVGGFKKGITYKLSALEAYSLFNEASRNDNIKAGKLVLDVAMLAVGVGEISAAYRAYETSRGAYALYLLIKAGTDTGMGLADITIQNTLATQWSQTTEGQKNLKHWNTICTAYMATSLTASAVDGAIKKLGFKTITNEDEFVKVCDELEGVGNVGSVKSLLAKWDELTVAEAKNLYAQLAKTEIQGTKIVRSQSEILLELNQRGITNPYNFSYDIEDYVLSKDAFFIRGYNQHKEGRWLISTDEITDFSSLDDFISKTALPVVDEYGNILKPDKIVIVKIPSGTTIRKSIARPQDWGGQGHLSGGATQYEIVNFNKNTMLKWFKDIGNINEYIK